jgi:hypothetical protein
VPWSRADLLAGQRHYVVTLTLGSRVLHFSHEALDIVQDDGSFISVAAGLIADIDATRALQIQQTTVPLRSVSMSIITEAEDWAAIVADGYDLAAGVGELSEWIPGRTWEDRQIILTGLLDAPTYGARGEPLAYTLKNHPMQDRGQILPPTAIVDAQTWPNAHEHAEGRNYPLVIGQPGLIGSTRYHGSPGLVVSVAAGTVLICDGEVQASKVSYLEEADPEKWVSVDVNKTTDGRGRTVSTITMNGETWTAHSSGSTVDFFAPVSGADAGETEDGFYRGYVGKFSFTTATAALRGVEFLITRWNSDFSLGGSQGRARVEQFDGTSLPAAPGHLDEAVVRPVLDGQVQICWTGGGGILNRTRTSLLRTAGDVLEHLFQASTLNVDRGRTAAAAELLQGYLIDCYIDDPVGVWEWIQGNLLPILPISIRYGPSGLYPIVWRSVIEDEQGSLVQSLNADDGDIVRVGVVETSSTLHGELANTIRVAYAVDSETGDYRAAYLLHGDPDRISNGSATASSRITRVSVARYGEIPVELQTSVVWDRSTAAAVAYQAALRHALPVRRINYLCPQAFGWLEEGCGVQLTDSELSLSNAFGLVSEVQDYTDGSCRIQVTLLDPVVRD